MSLLLDHKQGKTRPWPLKQSWRFINYLQVCYRNLSLVLPRFWTTHKEVNSCVCFKQIFKQGNGKGTFEKFKLLHKIMHIQMQPWSCHVDARVLEIPEVSHVIYQSVLYLKIFQLVHYSYTYCFICLNITL